MQDKEPLYRRINSRTRGVRHGGGEYKFSRNAKREDPTTRGSMHGKKHQGLDYTPLFRFLLSKVGKDWTDIHSQAVARLDRPDPIFWIVALNDADKKSFVRVGENSYYSGLHVDQNNCLARVDPDLKMEDMKPNCSCCTHTFNGQAFTKKFEAT
ncbi:hypothetical protein FJW08_09960 [Mesorhizobium sp. B3-2-1]|nr:hypothetical protein FJW08_09960 [Mesorhizobium sp. B3-2-1]